MALPEYLPTMPAPTPLPLREEADIMSSWEATGTPLVSVLCATYNHADYLEDALRGLLGQVTSFPFEVIVRDDASTDGTTELLLGYAAKYAHIIRPVIEKENQHSKGIRANPALLPFARGEYVALCEGDDYWITSDKLEKQVNLLRAYPQSPMSVARTVMCKKHGLNLLCETQFTGNDKELQSFEDIKQYYFHTSTYLIRTDIYRSVIERYLGKIEYGDTALRYMLADIGPIVLLKEIVSVYRITGSGIWTSLDKPNQVAWNIRVAEGFYRHFNPSHRKYFAGRLLFFYGHMLLNGVWAFNKRSAFANILRFSCLFLKYGIRIYCPILLGRIFGK